VLQDILGDKYDVRDCGLCGHDAVRAGHGNERHATYWGTPALNQSKAMAPNVSSHCVGRRPVSCLCTHARVLIATQSVPFVMIPISISHFSFFFLSLGTNL
jgi:hypothetical protein